MLKKSDYYKIGEIRKTHGVKGEMMLISDFSIDFEAIEDWLFFNLEECLVPFKVVNIRETGDKNALFICKTIDNIEVANEYVGVEIFMPLSSKTETENMDEPTSFIGYNVVNEENNETLGKIIDFIESNYNPLLEIEPENGENILLPFNEEFILGLEENDLIVRLPEGLLDL